ncbi:MAG: cytochrome c biogenesis protein CcsA [Pirellulales bacterium]
MLTGVTILCFTASYAVALALEISRLFFRSGVRGAVMLGFAGAGLFAHTVYLYNEAVKSAAMPLCCPRDWFFVAAWVLAATYLYLTYYHPHTSIGLFLLPLVLVLIGVGYHLAATSPFPQTRAAMVWGMIHGALLLLGSVAVMVGFVAGLMYLVQTNRLKRKLPPKQGLRLPSLEWLRRVNSRAIVVSMLLVGAGLLAGSILNAVNRGGQTQSLAWSDPLVVTSAILFGWLVVANVSSLLYKPAREGRKVAYLTVISFFFLVLALAVGLLVNTEHRGTPDKAAARASAGEHP